MNTTIYAIFHYESDTFKPAQVFLTLEDAKNKYNELTSRFRNDNYINEEWDEIGGIEFANSETDTIIRLCSFEIDINSVNDGKIFAFMDKEQERYFQIGHCNVSTDKDEIDDNFMEVMAQYRLFEEEYKDEPTLSYEFAMQANEYTTSSEDDGYYFTCARQEIDFPSIS